MKFLAILYLIILVSSANGEYVHADETKISFESHDTIHSNLIFGAIAPEVTKFDLASKLLALKFSSSANDASAAKVKNYALDIKQGFFINIRFKTNSKVSNSYPRLLEQAKTFSIHTVTANHSLKLLLSGSNRNNFAQLILPEATPKIWHEVRAAYDPATKKIYLQLNNSKRLEKQLTFPVESQPDNPLILGAGSMQKSPRGFDGLISEFRIISPYRFDTKDFIASKSNLSTSDSETPGIRHILISSLANRHLAFPGVAKLPNGELAVVFREGAAHVCPYGRICISYSKDGGKNWSAPVSISDTASDERDPSIQTLPDGRLLLTHGGWNSWMSSKRLPKRNEKLSKRFASETAYIQQVGPEKFGGSRYLFSNDNGKSWSSPVKAKTFCPHGPFFYDKYLYSSTLRTEGKTRYVDFWRSDLQAEHWHKISTIAKSASSFNDGPVYEEPHSLVLNDGTFVTAIRVPNGGHMLVSFSYDKGGNWSQPIKTSVRGYPQHLLQLKDGRLLATYGYRYHPFGIRACISNDGGKTWDIKNEIILRNNGENYDLGYPVSIELEDGQVLTVYYHNTLERPDCFIEGAIYKP